MHSLSPHDRIVESDVKRRVPKTARRDTVYQFFSPYRQDQVQMDCSFLHIQRQPGQPSFWVQVAERLVAMRHCLIRFACPCNTKAG